MDSMVGGGVELVDPLTTTENEFVALKGGKPSSVTTVWMMLVLGACALAGVQVIIPFVSMSAPVGGSTSEYDKMLVGISESLAVLVTISVVRASIVRSGWAGRVGALFTSVTTTVNLLV